MNPVPADTRAPLWAILAATFFGAGRLKPGPGTWGSLATVIVWALASSRIPPASRTWATIVAAAAVTLIGIPAATRVARAYGSKDPQFVVIDEVAGTWIALLFCPPDWRYGLLSLVLFRLFDITKPFPIRRIENLPEGWGIVLDDVAAGLYALGVASVLRIFIR